MYGALFPEFGILEYHNNFYARIAVKYLAVFFVQVTQLGLIPVNNPLNLHIQQHGQVIVLNWGAECLLQLHTELPHAVMNGAAVFNEFYFRTVNFNVVVNPECFGFRDISFGHKQPEKTAFSTVFFEKLFLSLCMRRQHINEYQKGNR
ncbi:MAG: hypothetical protein LRY76_01425 [Alphaproteobacteria bacterium]|nr:hypothetical protein [Alphaproteobacteria bacterium]MCD8570192.1 hypothetical protein [Alphaproteobacteria bacterium]